MRKIIDRLVTAVDWVDRLNPLQSHANIEIGQENRWNNISVTTTTSKSLAYTGCVARNGIPIYEGEFYAMYGEIIS